MSFSLLKPELYSCDPTGRVSLTGGRCSACGYVFFPMQARGCEKCGAHGAQITQMDLGNQGRLAAAATVHVHAGKSRTAPFVLGTIDLDSGPRIRTLLDRVGDAESLSGDRVSAVLVEAPDREGATRLDLRFRLA